MIDNEARHKALCDGIHDTYVRKNHDYGNSFSATWDDYGMTSALVRMSDKWRRINSLAANGEQKVQDEAITDSLLDLANYAIMTVMEIERRQGV